MSRGPLPSYVEPFRLCQANAIVSGDLAAKRLERISEFAVGTADDVNVELHFSRDADGRHRINGTIDTVVHVTCERCLAPLDIQVHADVGLLAVAAGAKVPETEGDADCIEVIDERLSLVALVEDEVLLALPPFPAHESCDMVAYDRGEDAAVVMPDGRKTSPFEVLGALKDRK